MRDQDPTNGRPLYSSDDRERGLGETRARPVPLVSRGKDKLECVRQGTRVHVLAVWAIARPDGACDERYGLGTAINRGNRGRLRGGRQETGSRKRERQGADEQQYDDHDRKHGLHLRISFSVEVGIH